MNVFVRQRNLVLSCVVTIAVGAIGCGPSSNDVGGKESGVSEKPHEEAAAQADDHSGWWCVEHGVPEAECALCNSALIPQFKAKGDWCEKHDRPESQCFLCDPSRFDKFAARYEAKFGKKPPQPVE